VARSRAYVWVTVDRDRTPEVPKKYNVSAYPTLLFLNPEDEMVHRFSGYREVSKLLEEFDDADRRWKLYRDGEVWDLKAPRPPEILEGKKVTRIPAPFPGVPGGLAAYGDDLFVAERGRIHRIDGKTGEAKSALAAPESIADLASDGELVFALEFGWTAGKPIHVIDPETGRIVREIVTKENRKKKGYGAKGIAWRDARLWVLEGMRGVIHEVHPETGDVLSSLQCKAKWLSGLAWNGRRFVAGGREHVYLIDPASGEVSLAVRVEYRLRSVAVSGGDVLLMEQPVFGFDRRHQRIQLWPEKNWIYRVEGIGAEKEEKSE